MIIEKVVFQVMGKLTEYMIREFIEEKKQYDDVCFFRSKLEDIWHYLFIEYPVIKNINSYTAIVNQLRNINLEFIRKLNFPLYEKVKEIQKTDIEKTIPQFKNQKLALLERLIESLRLFCEYAFLKDDIETDKNIKTNSISISSNLEAKQFKEIDEITRKIKFPKWKYRAACFFLIVFLLASFGLFKLLKI